MIVIIAKTHYPINPRELKSYRADGATVTVKYRNDSKDIYQMATPDDADIFLAQVDLEFLKQLGRA